MAGSKPKTRMTRPQKPNKMWRMRSRKSTSRGRMLGTSKGSMVARVTGGETTTIMIGEVTGTTIMIIEVDRDSSTGRRTKMIEDISRGVIGAKIEREMMIMKRVALMERGEGSTEIRKKRRKSPISKSVMKIWANYLKRTSRSSLRNRKWKLRVLQRSRMMMTTRMIKRESLM